MWLSVLVGTPAAVLLFFAARPLSSLLGASGEVLDHATTYLSVSAVGVPFFLVTLLSVRVFYPHFLRGSPPPPEDEEDINQLKWLCNVFLIMAAAVPMAGVIMLTVLNVENRLGLIVLSGVAAVGFAMAFYLNGVLHHVYPSRRPAVMRALLDALVPGGLLAVFENNPWNPGARMVMRRIPFDRAAVPLSPREARWVIGAAGFRVLSLRSLFYFPRLLAFLRPAERLLARVPLGAQYWVLAAKP